MWLQGTREQKENKTGNVGTKAYFREQGTPKSKNTSREFTGTQGKFCWEQGNMDPVGGGRGAGGGEVRRRLLVKLLALPSGIVCPGYIPAPLGVGGKMA